MSRKKRGDERERDEVSELIQAAEDEMLLKLSVNSHMSRGSSSSYIDPDLERRFQALKSSSSKPTSTIVSPNPVSPNPSTIQNDVDDHNLLARFAALKSSLPSSSSSSSSSSSANPHKSSVVDLLDQVGNNDDEDEVQKLIRWAIDAARLDPSPPSDTDDDNDDDDDSNDDEINREKKGRRN